MLVKCECVVMKESEIVVEIVLHDVIIRGSRDIIIPSVFYLRGEHISDIQVSNRIKFVHGINLL